MQRYIKITKYGNFLKKKNNGEHGRVQWGLDYSHTFPKMQESGHKGATPPVATFFMQQLRLLPQRLYLRLEYFFLAVVDFFLVVVVFLVVVD